MLAVAVIDTAHRLVAASNTPVYLRARFAPDDDAAQPTLEQLAGTLLDSPLHWRRVSLH